jgi:hypothetical protein
MVIFSNGFTKFAFSSHLTRFQDSLRSITGPDSDGDLLRFVTAVLGSRLMQYIAFHSGSSNGIGRDKLHLYESLNLPFPLPDHDLAPQNADEIICEVANIFRGIERVSDKAASRRSDLASEAWVLIQPMVEEYFSVTDAERILIDETINISQPSIHRPNLDGDIPSLAFPRKLERKRYAETLCGVLNRLVRRHGIKISAEGRVSQKLNLILLSVIFGGERKPYDERDDDEQLWKALDRVSEAAQRNNKSLSYLRGFSYFESDRLHMLKPATMRNWCRTAALNDADAIFEHLARQNA